MVTFTFKNILFFFIFLLALTTLGCVFTLKKEDMAQKRKGSFWTAFGSRKALQGYLLQLQKGTLMPDDVRKYIELGGSLGTVQSYNLFHLFFVGSPAGSVLNYFIKSENEVEPLQTPEARLESLALLLEAGASPNHGDVIGSHKFTNLSQPPVLFAPFHNDSQALKLLLDHGGNPNLTFSNSYMGFNGPALVHATNPEVLELLLSSGAQLEYKDQHGDILTVVSYHKNKLTLAKIK